MRERTQIMLYAGLFGATVAGAIAASAGQVQADDPNSAPNPYHVVEHWAKLPEGRVWGQAIGVDIDRDGTSLWVFDRCGGKTAPARSRRSRNSMPRPAGRELGSGLFNWPHGLFAAPTATSGSRTARTRPSAVQS